MGNSWGFPKPGHPGLGIAAVSPRLLSECAVLRGCPRAAEDGIHPENQWKFPMKIPSSSNAELLH